MTLAPFARNRLSYQIDGARPWGLSYEKAGPRISISKLAPLYELCGAPPLLTPHSSLRQRRSLSLIPASTLLFPPKSHKIVGIKILQLRERRIFYFYRDLLFSEGVRLYFKGESYE